MADIRTVELADYLASTANKKWQYGELDCCTFMADWLLALGFPDVMADRRGTYSTRDEYVAAIESEGGIIRSCKRRFASIGLHLTKSHLAGAVALVIANGNPTGSICTSERMRAVVTSVDGLVIAPLVTVAAWSFDIA